MPGKAINRNSFINGHRRACLKNSVHMRLWWPVNVSDNVSQWRKKQPVASDELRERTDGRFVAAAKTEHGSKR